MRALTPFKLLMCTSLLTLCGCGGGTSNTNNSNGNTSTDGTPAIGLSVNSLALSGHEGLGGNLLRRFELSNDGDGTLEWRAGSDSSWVTVEPSSGSITDKATTLTVTVDAATLRASDGPHVATLTIEAPDADTPAVSLSMTLTLDNAECETLAQNIRADRTLSSGCYVAATDVTVFDGATLTLEPGVFVVFESGIGMTVNTDGRLSAIGTPAKPIFFTGSEKMAGHWNGLLFDSSDGADNALENVTIEFAGFERSGGLQSQGTLSNTTQLTVVDTVLRDNGTFGLWTDEHIDFNAFETNIVTANVSGAASLPANQVGMLDSSSVFFDNDVDIIRVRGGTVEDDQTWRNFDADYQIFGDVEVEARLTVQAGATLAFDANRTMIVKDGGSLTARGTASESIRFTGTELDRGHWAGLRFTSSDSASNFLEYVTLEYGGGALNGILSADGTPSRPTSLSLMNCTLQHSVTGGFYFDDDTVVSAFSDNTVTDNGGTAGSLLAKSVAALGIDSTFSGNDEDFVEIRGGAVTDAATWQALDVPYQVSSDITVNAELTLQPGVNLIFADNQDMSMTDGGALRAIGTEAEPIVFAGAESSVGFWGGLHFDKSNSTFNRLEYVTVEYGGSKWNANLYLSGTADEPTIIEVINSMFVGSARWGILLDSNSIVNSDIETSNKFSENTLEDVRFP